MSKVSVHAPCLAQPRACPLTVNSGKASGASRRAWCRGRGCSAGGSQYRWFQVSVFTTQGPSPIMATTSSLDIARSRFSPWNTGSLIDHSELFPERRSWWSVRAYLPKCGGMVLRLAPRSRSLGTSTPARGMTVLWCLPRCHPHPDPFLPFPILLSQVLTSPELKVWK